MPMTPEETTGAAIALLEWLQSQDIQTVDAISVCTRVLGHAIAVTSHSEPNLARHVDQVNRHIEDIAWVIWRKEHPPA